MTLFLDDGDVRLYHGDALETVSAMPDESVDCVVTSPPYWGLRDYGTASWAGGDPACDHRGVERRTVSGGDGKQYTNAGSNRVYSGDCACGASRVDRQMGLEPTPDLFVQGMVELFREIRRVLAPHGTCWVNLGDSFDDKQLVGIPWRVAFALQADGWWLRSDIIWAKPNPMPESVTDRPTKAHEYVFLLTKQPRYWFDTEAVREAYEGDPEYRYGRVGAYQNRAINGLGDGTTPTRIVGPDGRRKTTVKGADGSIQHRDGERWPGSGRNVRSVWQIATQPYPEAHFATYPEELARRCILAGCPTRVCVHCNKPWERHIETGESDYARLKREQGHGWRDMDAAGLDRGVITKEGEGGQTRTAHGTVPSLRAAERTDHGFRPSCSCGTPDVSALCDDNVDAERACGEMPILRSGLAYRPGVVLDPFIGSGTTAKVARDHQRHAIGIDLNQTYLELAARRLQQLSLLT